MLKMLLQILCRKIRSAGTLVIALAKKVITLILKFTHISHPKTNNESFTNCPLYSNRYQNYVISDLRLCLLLKISNT